MKRCLILLLMSVGCGHILAQTILMKNGNVISADGLVRNGDLLMVLVKTPSGGKGRVGFNISDVKELNLPAPPAIAVADAENARGDFQNAHLAILPVLDEQKTLRDLPGNWWAQAALADVQALSGLGRTAEAGSLITEISSYSQSPEILTAAKLQVALATNYTDATQALAAFDEIINQSSDTQTLSQAWIREGDIRAGEHEFDEALMDYLTVTVFYPDHNPLVPKALWGVGQAYDKLKDKANATKTYLALASNYSDTPEAGLAKAELQKKTSQLP